MQFNGDVNDQDLCTLADKFVKTDDVDFPLADKALYANMGEREVLSWIFSVYGGWNYDASGNSNLPSATTHLVANQTNYTLPDILELKAVSYKLEGQNTWQPLKPITLEDIQSMGYAEAEFERIPALPIWYRPVGNVLKIYPAADFSQDDSLETQFNRDSVAFTAASTSSVPGFATTFHEAIAVYMALQFAKINNMESKITQYQRLWDGNEEVTKQEGGFKSKIKAYYRARFVEMAPQNIKRNPSIVDQYT